MQNEFTILEWIFYVGVFTAILIVFVYAVIQMVLSFINWLVKEVFKNEIKNWNEERVKKRRQLKALSHIERDRKR